MACLECHSFSGTPAELSSGASTPAALSMNDLHLGDWVLVGKTTFGTFVSPYGSDGKNAHIRTTTLCEGRDPAPCKSTLGGRTLLEALARNERVDCARECPCMWSNPTNTVVRLGNMVKASADRAVAELDVKWAAHRVNVDSYWADDTASKCPNNSCPSCHQVFCGFVDCQDGSTPSGGDWSVVCAGTKCAVDRKCRFCELVYSSAYANGILPVHGQLASVTSCILPGSTPVCCKCQTGHPGR